MRRADFIQMVEAALAAGQTDYALQAIRRYLAEWPTDLGLQLQLARAYLQQGDAPAAVQVLDRVVAADPEDFRAQRLLAHAAAGSDPGKAQTAAACAHIGDGLGPLEAAPLPAWAAPTRAAFLAERVGDLETARRESWASLAAETASPLPSLIHLSTLWHAGRLDLALPLAEGFNARWPEVVAFKLCLAECLFATSANARAMALLHDAAAQDVAGQVAARHWGEAHPYRTLWPADLSATLPGPLPAGLLQALGLNRLNGKTAPAKAATSPASPEPAPSEELRDIQAQLDALTARLGGASAEAERPALDHYIVLSSRTRLTQQYGGQAWAQMDQAMRALAQAQRRMRGVVVYVDEAASLQPFGLQPVDATRAWDIKLLVGALAAKLRARGEALGALLIVGGPEIIPFHHLPNPTEDPDADIPSDNPYATADENYFVPEWPVGRIPSGAGHDPRPLLRALHEATRQHSGQTGAKQRSWWRALWRRLRQLWPRPRAPQLPSFGYTASIWRQASAAVYHTIGDPRELLSCPPVDAARLPADGLAPARLSYFNLHGVEDGPNWYGQRSHDDPAHLPEYPIALRPADVANSGRAPVVVFSEACFGANILGRSAEDALCLRFLEAGTRALVGSTKIAYGSVDEPLIGADLLGRFFWQNVGAGLPVGEGLRLAKLQLAQEMHARQGFLDGEDQKTLISFVLYGDPLAAPMPGAEGAARLAKRRVLQATAFRPTTLPATPIEAALTPETVAQIKNLVSQYLPEMRDAELRAARSRRLPAQAKTAARETTTVTLAKTVRVGARRTAQIHAHYARVTLDEQGKIIKLSVSR